MILTHRNCCGQQHNVWQMSYASKLASYSHRNANLPYPKRTHVACIFGCFYRSLVTSSAKLLRQR